MRSQQQARRRQQRLQKRKQIAILEENKQLELFPDQPEQLDLFLPDQPAEDELLNHRSLSSEEPKLESDEDMQVLPESIEWVESLPLSHQQSLFSRSDPVKDSNTPSIEIDWRS